MSPREVYKMAQADNTVQIIGRVVKGPKASFVGGDPTKMRLKYQVQVEARKRDNNQTFCPWVRTLGNQAKKDYENIRTGDIVAVQGRIVTRKDKRKRYFVIDDAAKLDAAKADPDAAGKGLGDDTLVVAAAVGDETAQPALREIDIEDEDALEELQAAGKVIFCAEEERIVTEIQGEDVRYFSRWLGDMKEEDLKRLLTEKVIDAAVRRVIDRKLEEEKEKAAGKKGPIDGVEDIEAEDAEDVQPVPAAPSKAVPAGPIAFAPADPKPADPKPAVKGPAAKAGKAKSE
jgi:primosomal replication protein N